MSGEQAFGRQQSPAAFDLGEQVAVARQMDLGCPQQDPGLLGQLRLDQDRHPVTLGGGPREIRELAGVDHHIRADGTLLVAQREVGLSARRPNLGDLTSDPDLAQSADPVPEMLEHDA